MILKREKIAFDLGFRIKDGSIIKPNGEIVSGHITKSGFREFGIRANQINYNISVHKLLGYQIYGDVIWNRKFRITHKDKNKLNNTKENIEITKWHGGKNVLLTGQQIGRLLVGEKKREKFISYYLCMCECGNKLWVTHTNLKHHTKSCGCLQKELVTKNNKNKRGMSLFVTDRKNIGRRKTLEEVILRRQYGYYVRNAINRDIDWKITEENFKHFIFGPCYYCGIIGGTYSDSHWNGENKGLCHNGVDRIDNKVGYLYSNCVTACKKCNRAKHTMTFNEFEEWAFRLSKNLKRSK